MRTTLSIDQDVLIAAKHEARRQNITLGEMATELMRTGLRARGAKNASAASTVGRFALLAPRDEIITAEHVRKLMEQEGV